MRKPGKDVVALVFLVSVVTLFFARELLTDRTIVTFRLTNVHPWLSEARPDELDQPSVTSDCTFSYYPRRVFATRMMREGNIPLWNPHQFCGTPFLANFQSGVFYPVNLALYGLDPPTQMDMFLYIHFVIAAVFAYLLARKLGITAGGATVASLAFTFCGFLVTRYGQPTFISTASWLPALILFGELLVESPSLRRAGLLALALSLSILAGFPQLVLFNIYALFLYVALRLFLLKGRSLRSRGMIVGFLALSLIVACLVCSFQILPTYELSRFSYRKELPYDIVRTSTHDRLAALKYFVPDLLGNPVDLGAVAKALHRAKGGATFSNNFVSTTGYVGILPFLLAALGLSLPNRRFAPFIGFCLVSLLAVFGTRLLTGLYYAVPGFNFSRIDRVIVIYMFGLAMLAGHGFDTVMAGSARRRLLFVGIGFLGFAVVLTAWLKASGLDMVLSQAPEAVPPDVYLRYASGKVMWFLVLSLAAGALVLVRLRTRLPAWAFLAIAIGILLVDLIPNGLKFKVSQPADRLIPESSLVESLKRDPGYWRIAKFGAEVIPSNTATLLEIDDVHGYDALNVNHYLEVLGVVDSTVISIGNAALRRRIGAIGNPAGLDSKVLDLLNVKYVLSPALAGQDRRRSVSWINGDYLPRAFLVERAHRFATYDAVLAYMKTAEFDPGSEVLLVGEGAAGQDSTAAHGPGAVEIIEHTPNEVVISADVRRLSYLVVSDTYYPGWRVYVDGVEAEVLRADYAFRAVALDPGIHKVRMVYRSLLFSVGIIFSAAGVALLAVLISAKSEMPIIGG
jgi:hypothetical protein